MVQRYEKMPTFATLKEKNSRKMKEKQQDYTLMKARSYRRVITTGLRLYTSSFRKVFRATWPFTLALILIAAVCGAIVTTRLLPVALQILALPAYKWLIAQEHWMMHCRHGPSIGDWGWWSSLSFDVLMKNIRGAHLRLPAMLPTPLKDCARRLSVTGCSHWASYWTWSWYPVCLFVLPACHHPHRTAVQAHRDADGRSVRHALIHHMAGWRHMVVSRILTSLHTDVPLAYRLLCLWLH